MPSYSQVKLHLQDANVTATSTFTASGQVITASDIADLGEFFRDTQVNNVKVKIKTVPTEAATAQATLVFLNGTSTFASISIGTAADESWVDATMTHPNAKIPADTEPTVNALTTGTASSDTGLSIGAYDIWFEL